MDVKPLSAKDYYLRRVSDALRNFEHHERTVSHTFRTSHPFLQGRCYGEAFFDSIKPFCPVVDFRHVVEIGAGCGDLARRFIDEWAAAAGSKTQRCRYTIVELSEVLMQSQQAVLHDAPIPVHFLHKDAQRLQPSDLEGGPVGLVIGNEMIADLDVWDIHSLKSERESGAIQSIQFRGQPPPDLAPERVMDVAARYELVTLLRHRRTLFPIGLLEMLECLHEVLSDGSAVVLTEYFETKSGGKINPLYRHCEFALSLDLVCHLAQRVGFRVRAVPLKQFLGMEIPEPVVARSVISFAARTLGHDLAESRPYTAEMFRAALGANAPEDLGGLLVEGELQRFLSRFYALVLIKRPKASATDLNAATVVRHEPDGRLIGSSTGEPYLVRSHPFSYCKLSDSGRFLWQAMDGKRSVEDLAARLVDHYDVDIDGALADTQSFIAELLEQGCVSAERTGDVRDES